MAAVPGPAPRLLWPVAAAGPAFRLLPSGKCLPVTARPRNEKAGLRVLTGGRRKRLAMIGLSGLTGCGCGCRWGAPHFFSRREVVFPVIYYYFCPVADRGVGSECVTGCLGRVVFQPVAGPCVVPCTIRGGCPFLKNNYDEVADADPRIFPNPLSACRLPAGRFVVSVSGGAAFHNL